MTDFSRPIKEWMPWQIYPGYLEGMPDLIVGAMPRDVVPSHRPIMEQFRVWIVEDRREMEKWKRLIERRIDIIDGRLAFEEGPDQACYGESYWRNNARDTSMGVYESSRKTEAGRNWPWIVLVGWSKRLVSSISLDDPMALARGRYTYETFGTSNEAMRHMTGIGSRLMMRGSKVIIRHPEPKDYH